VAPALRVSIGTLFEYRNTERYGSTIGDASERWFPVSGTRDILAGLTFQAVLSGSEAQQTIQ
jgi:hypothetical protein